MRVVKPKQYDRPFTTLSNVLLRDTRLSDGAFRLLVFLLTQGKQYNPTERGLSKHFNVTERTIRSRARELKEKGYLRMEIFRYPDKGREIVWIVSEFPLPGKQPP